MIEYYMMRRIVKEKRRLLDAMVSLLPPLQLLGVRLLMMVCLLRAKSRCYDLFRATSQ
jgi:hypothetical protein